MDRFPGLRGNGACCSFADAVACLTAQFPDRTG
jgi:hypothetical protein